MTTPNPTSGLLWFSILTLIYTIIQYITGRNGKGASPYHGMIYFLIYAILVFIGEFFINANLTNSLCDSVQWSTVVLVTGLPWILMFGSLVIMLKMFPGWLAPFSNTFGYGIAKLAGLSNVLNSILALNPKVKGKQNTVIDEAIAHIYSDKSLLVNEITVTNFDYFWNKMQGLFRPGVATNIALKHDLWNMIWLKNIVAQFLWLILVGIMVISVSYNYIINAGCSLSADEIQKRHNQSQTQLQKTRDAAQTEQEKRIYTTYE